LQTWRDAEPEEAKVTPSSFKVTFEEEGHAYTLNGEPAPSVTGMLSAEGMSDYSWCDESDQRRGQAVHRLAHLVSRDWRGSTVQEVVNNSGWDEAKTTPKKLVGYGYAAAKFLVETGFRPTLVEQPVGSLRLGICGTPDAYGTLPSRVTLLPDYKSGTPLPAVWIQLNLYAYMLEETFGIKTDQVAPVHLKADGSYKLWPPQPAGGNNLTVGISLVNVYKWRKQHGML
jgi:hypothetical protein